MHKKKRYTEVQIAFALRQAAKGTPAADIVGKMSVSDQRFYLWKKHYADMGVSEVNQLKEFGEENRRFKHLVAELTLDRQILQNVLSRKL